MGVLEQRLADALRHAAVDLPRADHRVEHPAEVVDHGVAVDRHGAGLGIDLDLARRGQPFGWFGGSVP